MRANLENTIFKNTAYNSSTKFLKDWTKEKIIEMRKNSELIFTDCTEDSCCLNELEQKILEEKNLTLAKPFFN